MAQLVKIFALQERTLESHIKADRVVDCNSSAPRRWEAGTESSEVCCNPGYPQAHDDPSSSCSQVLGFAQATMPHFAFLLVCVCLLRQKGSFGAHFIISLLMDAILRCRMFSSICAFSFVELPLKICCQQIGLWACQWGHSLH